MLLLCGGASLLCSLSPWLGGESLRAQLTHAAWGQTLTCWDLVMPLFIFIVGAGMPFAFASYHARKYSIGRILWRIGRRCVLLFLLGMLVQGNLTSADPSRMSLATHFRPLPRDISSLRSVCSSVDCAHKSLLAFPASCFTGSHCASSRTDPPSRDFFCRMTIWLISLTARCKDIGRTERPTRGSSRLSLSGRSPCSVCLPGTCCAALRRENAVCLLWLAQVCCA